MLSIKKIVLIGSGNVATQLAAIFTAKGNKILQIYSQNKDHAEKLASVLGCDSTDNIQKINKNADLYVIAVKDDAIAEIDAVLRLPGKLVVHTSGAVELSTIRGISDKTGVFYPLQTFSKDWGVDWIKIPIFIEASDAESAETLKRFAKEITKSVTEIDSATRKRIHVAAAFANNFINFLLGESKEILGNKIPFKVLEPLVRETIEKAFSGGVEGSQTGPARRHDMKTIETHLKLLEKLPEAQGIYKIITEAIMKKYDKPSR